MTPVPRPDYRVGSPKECLWVEALNTNAKRYGGDGGGDAEPLQTKPIKWDGRPAAVDINIPGMSVLYFLYKPLPPGLAKSQPAEATPVANA